VASRSAAIGSPAMQVAAALTGAMVVSSAESQPF